VNALLPFIPATTPPDLQKELDQHAEGPADFYGPIDGSDDPGFRLAHPSQPTYHPAAGHIAAIKRAGLEEPATPEMMHQWLALLASGVKNPPESGEAFGRSFDAVWFFCRKFPAACWADDTVIPAAKAAHGFWPSAIELHNFMETVVERIRRDIEYLDRKATADRVPSAWRAIEAAQPYDPGPAPAWCFNKTSRHPANDEIEEPVHISRSAVERQLDDLGCHPEPAAAKAALAKREEEMQRRLAHQPTVTPR
jgi:hypothetical protein